uniref:glucosaminidase domain-containing protein n=1 Tax=Alistipes sp. TaxID=1872444 RepID=UPI00405779A8
MRLLRTIQLAALLIVISLFAAQAKERQTREEYVEKYKAIAIAHMERYGIPASITMAQGILESDSGNSRLSTSSNNHFGIKCKKHWTGDRVYHDDDAKGECFRAYPSVEASYQDHADFLDQSPRYDSLFAYPADDYRSWARGLKAAGYATAPDYAERLVKIIESMKLYLLDKENGNKIYSAAQTAVANTEAWFESNIATSDEQINPNAFRVTVNSHKGYGVYRTNHTFYVVAKEGDTFESVGEIFDISAKMLRKFNDVAKDAQLSKGDIIYIERKKTQWLGNVMQHKVVREENLYTLSQSYGIRQKSLAKLNRLRSNEDVRKGDIIRLK